MDTASQSAKGEARAAERARALADLAAIGMNIARALERQALALAAASEAVAGRIVAADLAPAEAASAIADLGRGPDLGLSFSRLSRAVRLTLALEARLAERPLAAEPALAPVAVRDPDLHDKAVTGFHRTVRRIETLEAIEVLIDREPDDARAERLHDELVERLNAGEAEAGQDEPRVSAMIATICEALGLTPDWSLWEDEDWALNELESGDRASPYVAQARERKRRREAREAGRDVDETRPP